MPEKMVELTEEYCLTKVFMPAYLDNRRGMRKIARATHPEDAIIELSDYDSGDMVELKMKGNRSMI